MMMKKYASLLFALVLALSLSVSAAADSSGVYVYDDAALLTQEEYDTLTASAMAVADQYGCGVYVVTVDDMADYIDPDAVTEGEGMKAYNCPSCGAELICDETTAATSCPYCGNPTVVPGQFSGALKPEFVLPFRMTKDDAVRALRAHYRGKPFLPRSFTAGNHIEEIQGVYVPFWLFDGGAEGEVDYKAANSRTYRDDDYEVTETDHYDVRRAGSIAFEKIPVDASSKMPDDHMDSIEPFDYTQMQPFSTAYLPGYLADKYDVTVDDSRARADRRSRETLENALRETVTGYGTCVTDRTDIRLHRGKVHYALLPVWMLSTKWNGESFLFAMNGQTGKLVGDLPTDRSRYWGTFGAIAGAVTVALTVILQFM